MTTTGPQDARPRNGEGPGVNRFWYHGEDETWMIIGRGEKLPDAKDNGEWAASTLMVHTGTWR